MVLAEPNARYYGSLKKHVNTSHGEDPAIWNVVHVVTTVLCRSDNTDSDNVFSFSPVSEKLLKEIQNWN
jgi:hypothetical protein